MKKLIISLSISLTTQLCFAQNANEQIELVPKHFI